MVAGGDRMGEGRGNSCFCLCYADLSESGTGQYLPNQVPKIVLIDGSFVRVCATVKVLKI